MATPSQATYRAPPTAASSPGSVWPRSSDPTPTPTPTPGLASEVETLCPAAADRALAVSIAHRHDAAFRAACRTHGWSALSLRGTEEFSGFGAAWAHRSNLAPNLNPNPHPHPHPNSIPKPNPNLLTLSKVGPARGRARRQRPPRATRAVPPAEGARAGVHAGPHAAQERGGTGRGIGTCRQAGAQPHPFAELCVLPQ